MPKFVPRERKHRKLARQKTASSQQDGPANAEIVVPLSQSEKEEKRRKLQEELKAQQPETKISGKKRKRLNKYIDTKLKKEENLELLKKLAAQKVDTSLLQSAKKLGRVQETKRERFSRALQEERAGIDANGDRDAILYEKRDIAGEQDNDSDDNETPDPLASMKIVPTTVELATPGTSKTSFGTGLKRPLEVDESGKPVIKKRKRQKKTAIIEQPPSESESEELEDDASDAWNGFSDDEAQATRSTISHSDDDDDSSSARGGSSNPESDTESDYQSSSEGKPARVSAFKAWADSQRNEALDFSPSTAPINDEVITANFKPRAPSPDAALSEVLASAQQSVNSYRPEKAVVVPRSEEIQTARLQLPVVQEEQKIIEAVHNNPVTVVCGATGSGKTTQLPQMLVENGYTSKGMIGVTQPRRVAAQSVARRVAHEFGPDFGKQVGSQIRYDSNVSRNTKVKFMTDGILLREISQDFSLSKYSVIVIDEAHERSVNTDILIGMLSRIVPIRDTLSKEQPGSYHPLKLVIMSATLRVTDFIMNEKLFRSVKPPVVEAEGRQYPVTEHFAKKTQRDYVGETVRKVSRGHRKLPAGSILVFLTGQDEIGTVAKKLREALTSNEDASFANSRKPYTANEDKPANDFLEDDDERANDSDDEAEIIGLDGDDHDDEFQVEVDANAPQQRGGLKPHIVPLYGGLSSEQQMRVFDTPPEGHRMIVLATNIAETSLTIPDVRYVFDCGRSKEKHYDMATGVQEFKIDWISKASASQRMGRAGRTGPGHCYRLYSSAIYEQYFDNHTLPEILRTPIEGTVLTLKGMEVDNVVNFPFPTPPQREQLAQAERLLKNLGAIDSRSGKITARGRELQKYPVNPRFGRMLQLGLQHGVLPYTIAMVAGLAVGELFILETQVIPRQEALAGDDEDFGNDDRPKRVDRALESSINSKKQAFGRAHATFANFDDKSDAIKLLTAIAGHADADARGDKSFCSQYFLREKGMVEVQQLRSQLHNIMQKQMIERGQPPEPYQAVISPPKEKDIKFLNQIVAAGYIDQVAVRNDLLPSAISTGQKARRAIEVPYRTLLPSIAEADIDRASTLEEQGQQRSVYVHPSSLLAKLSIHEMPDYIVYTNLSRAAATTVEGKQKRTRMHPLTTAGPLLLSSLAEGSPLLEFGKPIGKIEEKDAGRTRVCFVGTALRDPNTAGTTWPMKAWKVQQTRKGKEWVVEKVLQKG
ncbi:Putative ATP-dependent RNA helicase [Fulvia fulva]|uniref:RNA helicase n=1 Tax=Passalora fulva TaxID=5499 RepID=A0A9Q8LAG2_PASFU|nr:Putative ATP-dependent RNA helicase [Fulvia fulva]KAK4631557.1 putative ATP-dependent RNA helicase [Fulvia fulva]UJO13780.1 Putative ATP-dependent RNA helicase [Fulvia fulva]WPV10579.1 Putative ATP-dependent RNA helicase [Fulvia fulva]WPV26812.1 Putative ATP-dependent RNA helicase [Fulvia fulva]